MNIKNIWKIGNLLNGVLWIMFVLGCAPPQTFFVWFMWTTNWWFLYRQT